MTHDLVFRLFSKKRKEFLQGIGTKILKRALEESANFFYSLDSKEDVELWMPYYLKHADAISDGITKMNIGTLVKSSGRFYRRLYNKIIQYAIGNGFGELITKQEEKQHAILEFCNIFENKELRKEEKAEKERIAHDNNPRYYQF